MTATRRTAWAPRLVLFDAAGVARALGALRATGHFDPVPTPWQSGRYSIAEGIA